MALSKEEVEKIALLARLGLTEEEKATYAKQLSSILEYVEQLKAIDTTGIELTAQVTGLENVMRDDAVVQIDEETRKKLLAQAPSTESDLIKTKSVF